VEIGLPASPQLTTIHVCPSAGHCYTYFNSAGDVLQQGSDPDAGAPRFLEITVNPVHPTCKGPTAPLDRFRCVTHAEQDAWCARRPDQAGTPWCTERPRNRLIVRPADGRSWNGISVKDWRAEPVPPVGTDAQGRPIRIECNAIRDGVIRDSTDKRREGSRLCRARFALTPTVRAEVQLDRFQSDRLQAEATSMIEYAEDLWQALTWRHR
jgi:hypothetical protein